MSDRKDQYPKEVTVPLTYVQKVVLENRGGGPWYDPKVQLDPLLAIEDRGQVLVFIDVGNSYLLLPDRAASRIVNLINEVDRLRKEVEELKRRVEQLEEKERSQEQSDPVKEAIARLEKKRPVRVEDDSIREKILEKCRELGWECKVTGSFIIRE